MAVLFGYILRQIGLSLLHLGIDDDLIDNRWRCSAVHAAALEEFTLQPHEPYRVGPRVAAPAPKDTPKIPAAWSPERLSFRLSLGTGSAL